MDAARSSPRSRWFKAVVALTILNSLGLLTLGGLEIARRVDERRAQAAHDRAMWEARRKAERVRSAATVRTLAHALMILADEQQLGRYPSEGEDWVAMLTDRDMIDPSMLSGPAGSGVAPAYYYAPPSAEALRDWQQGGEAPVIIYEDPALFDDGGNIARADTETRWLDRQSLEAMVRRLRDPEN